MPVDVRGRGRGQEYGGAGDLLRFAPAAHRVARSDAWPEVRVRDHCRVGFRGEGAGGDGVAGNAARAEFRRQRAHHARQALFGRGVDRVARAGQFADYRGDSDQAPCALAHHALGGEFGQQHAGYQVRVDQVADLGRRGGGQRLAVARAHIVHQDVQPAMFGIDAAERRLQGGVVADVESQRMRVQAVALQRVGRGLRGGGIAAVDQHARAAAAQRPRDAETQPAPRAGHQRDLPAQFEIAQIRQRVHVSRP
ncbi:hypothetical protein D9M68_726770 [compost metagenome]